MNFETIEDAIITELKAAPCPAAQVETYGGQLAEDAAGMPIDYPALFVVLEEADIEWIDGENFNEKDTFTVLCVSSDMRGDALLRKDEATGAYPMIRFALSRLTLKDFGLDIEKLQPIKIGKVLIHKTRAVYGVKFKTNFDTKYAPL